MCISLYTFLFYKVLKYSSITSKSFSLFSIVLIGKFNRRIDFRLECYSYLQKDEKAQIELDFLSNIVEIENFKTYLKILYKILIDNQ